MHDFIPDKVNYLLERMGSDPTYANIFASGDLYLPYRYDVSTLVNVIFERMRSRKGLKSIAYSRGVHVRSEIDEMGCL